MEYLELISKVLFSLILLGSIFMTMGGLPGNVVIFLAGLAYGCYEHFVKINDTVLLIVFSILIAAEVAEFIAGLLGARKVKASRRAMLAPFIGTILGGIGGTAVLPVIGSLLGAWLGAYFVTFLAEYSIARSREKAGRVAKSVLKGQLFGALVKTAAAVTMAGLLLYRLKGD